MPPKNTVPKNANTSTVTTPDNTLTSAPEATLSSQPESMPVKKSTRKAPVSKLAPQVSSEQTVSSAQPTDDKTPNVKSADSQTGGKKTTATKPATKRVVTKQTAGQVETSVVSQEASVVTKPKRAPRKTAPDVIATETKAVDNEQTAGDVNADEKQIRSFKVQLPGSDNFEGRFTGLTPYQAANKALSKYFREGDRDNAEVTFSICESTRKSKKSVYTYVGQRHRLDEPVKYTIQDGREIVKNFKNTLKKVKKSATVTATATV